MVNSTVIPIGTLVTALRNIASGQVWPPIIYAHDELRVMGYTIDEGVVEMYRVVTHNGIHVYVEPEDIQVKDLPLPAFAFQPGTSVYAKHSVWMESHPDRPKILSENEWVRIQSTLVRENKPAYNVKNNAGMELIVLEEALVETPNYPANVKIAIQKAFQDGYSRGHSRGLCCGRLYKEDIGYREEKHRETIAYLQELEDESDC